MLERSITIVSNTIFMIDVDNAARVDGVIGWIEYVRQFEFDTVAFFCKLIVCGAGDDLAFRRARLSSLMMAPSAQGTNISIGAS